MSPRKTAGSTAHFTPELFKFLRQLDRNNNKPWFEKNKERYLDHVRFPMLRFIADFGPRLKRISKHHLADPRPHGGSMFRIYRDTRFAKDKRPYKTAATARFPHQRGKDVHAPGFYIHLGIDGVYAAMGIWHPDGDALAGIRESIAERSKEWKRILSGKPFKNGLQLGGESLKRPPRGFDPEHPLIEDLKRKDFYAYVELDEKTACARDFLDRYTDLCRSGRPLLKFLTEAVGLEW